MWFIDQFFPNPDPGPTPHGLISACVRGPWSRIDIMTPGSYNFYHLKEVFISRQAILNDCFHQ